MIKPKRPKDTNQRAKFILDIATGEKQDEISNENNIISHKRRLSGLKGAKARSKKLSAKRRKAIAKKAAEKRWKTT